MLSSYRLSPLPKHAVDKLQKEVDGLKERASALLHRMRFMAGRVSEVRQLHQPSGSGQQQQEQQQQQQEQQQQQQLSGSRQQEQQEQQQQQQLSGSRQQGQQHTGMDIDGAAALPAATPGDGVASGSGDASAAVPSGAEKDHQAGGMECPVCLTTVPSGADIYVFSACGHAFCNDCASKLVLQSGLCAVCRAKVTRKQVVRVAAGGASSSGRACDPHFEELGGVSAVEGGIEGSPCPACTDCQKPHCACLR